MPTLKIADLPGRGVVRVAGPDAGAFLQGLITNDMDLLATQSAIHAGLLSPQGKILFEFFVFRSTPSPSPQGGAESSEPTSNYLLETQRSAAPALVKRLAMSKLRAKIEIADVSDAFAVHATWGGAHQHATGAVAFADPRDAQLGSRELVQLPALGANTDAAAYHAHRISLGVPEAGLDYTLGDTFPHEACFDRFGGASFDKGCYVGQEVVARMHNKTVVRKRVVRVRGDRELTAGAQVLVGSAVIGGVGSVAGVEGLAMLRLDRVAEAADKRQPVTSAGGVLTVDADAVERYRRSVAERPEIVL